MINSLSRTVQDEENKCTLPIKNQDNIIVHDDKKQNNIFIQFYARNSKIKHTKEDRNIIRKIRKLSTTQCASGKCICRPIELHEIHQAISSLKKKSPGIDNVTNNMLKLLNTKSQSLLCQEFNTIWERKEFPQPWKESVIIPIAKQGKDKNSVEGYRPISLNSSIGKLYEKIIHGRLTSHIRSKKLISSYQSGFRKGYRCEDGLATFVNQISQSFHKKQHTGAIFVDFKTAFDKVHSYRLIRKLVDKIKLGCLTNFYKNYLHGRKAIVRRGDKLSVKKRMLNGVPQGAILSPILFSTYIDDLPASLPKGVQVNMFADDVVLWYPGQAIWSIRCKLQKAMDCIVKWSQYIKWKFPPQKLHASFLHYLKRNKNLK